MRRGLDNKEVASTLSKRTLIAFMVLGVLLLVLLFYWFEPKFFEVSDTESTVGSNELSVLSEHPKATQVNNASSSTAKPRPATIRGSKSESAKVLSNNKIATEIPKVPQSLSGLTRPSFTELEALEVIIPEGKRLLNESGRYWLSDDSRYSKKNILALLQSAKQSKLESLLLISDLKMRCTSMPGAGIAVACDNWWKLKVENTWSDEKFNTLDLIEKHALEGNLNAQYQYHGALLNAVLSKEVNPAIEGERWLQQRQRMIHYLYRFSLAGDSYSSFLLADFYERDLAIEKNPFWSAVFYNQVSHVDSRYPAAGDYLYERYELDRDAVEAAWAQLYGVAEDE